jgi:hypothetical protein
MSPVVYSACIAAFITCYPLENAPDRYTKLVHKDKKNHGKKDPHAVKHSGIEKESDKQHRQEPLYSSFYRAHIHAVRIIR